MLSTYRPPTYQYNSAIFDPVIDLLELSGTRKDLRGSARRPVS